LRSNMEPPGGQGTTRFLLSVLIPDEGSSQPTAAALNGLTPRHGPGELNATDS
jgi:hypothetical protein